MGTGYRPGVARFIAFVHREGVRFLIFIEGVGEGHAKSLREAERVARAMALRHVLAAYPERGDSTPTNALRTLRLEVEIVLERPSALSRPDPDRKRAGSSPSSGWSTDAPS
jgi:hypothetical protein